MNLKTVSLAAAVIGALAVVPAPAHADTKTACTISYFNYDVGSMWFYCTGDNTQYFAYASPPATGCSAATKDTLTIWNNLIESQMRSKRSIDFDFAASTASCKPTVTSLRTH
ncbi:MAG TPA: hypothetical protein VHJ20_17490 [Polyangia bacterium]|nr:hypothetical protein [Polyangia bacterium]